MVRGASWSFWWQYTSATLIRHPNPAKYFIIDYDACITGLGAALHQQNEHGKGYPVAIASRTLRFNERKWTITELEALEVAWALETFQNYVGSFRTSVRADHSALVRPKTSLGKLTRLSCWVLRLQDCTFKSLHRPGAANRVADVLSRNLTSEQIETSESLKQRLIVAFVGEAEKCHLCWGQARGFFFRGRRGRCSGTYS